MDFLKKAAADLQGNQGQQQQHQQQQPQGEGYAQGGEQQQQQGGGGFFGLVGNKINAAAGGGPESEKNEDALDKGVDWVQENILKQGPQNNESAAEQAKDEKISDFIRDQYKQKTGKDVPVQDKERF